MWWGAMTLTWLWQQNDEGLLVGQSEGTYFTLRAGGWRKAGCGGRAVAHAWLRWLDDGTGLHTTDAVSKA